MMRVDQNWAGVHPYNHFFFVNAVVFLFMNYNDLIARLTPDLYENIKKAVELGKWPNGVCLTNEQREHCLQAIIAYDHQHKTLNERVGYIYNPKKDSSNYDQLDAPDEIHELKIK